MKYVPHRKGFTLVELLVVITIIGVLVGLLLPAVQAARESARRTQCCNNLRQLGLGCQHHEETHGHFPTGGWGEGQDGRPDRGFGRDQTGGWVYNILPFVEQEALHDLGLPGTEVADIAAGINQRVTKPLAILHCPTRRRAIPYPGRSGRRVARNDYAINGGTVMVINEGVEPSELSDQTRHCNGLSHTGSQVKGAHVHDGLSNTYLVAEKYLHANLYTAGTDPGDDANAYSGAENDLIRWTYDTEGQRELRPMRDRADEQPEDAGKGPGYHRFGSAHSAGWHAMFCDGSTRLLRYEIDPHVHRLLGDRDDRQVIDQTELR